MSAITVFGSVLLGLGLLSMVVLVVLKNYTALVAPIAFTIAGSVMLAYGLSSKESSPCKPACDSDETCTKQSDGSHKCEKNVPKYLDAMFNNTTTDLDEIGGILCNNFGTEWFEAMLKRNEVSLQDTSVCAHVNRRTCTAYSYLRRDLIPMLFMFPGVQASVPCGIILDTRKVWPLITLMAIVDGDTNNRSCCTNESGSPILTRSPWSASPGDLCIYNSMVQQVQERKLDEKYVKDSYAVYIPNKDEGVTGGTCDVSCNGDRTCMYNNSGGNINQWLMNASTECVNGKFANCFVFKEIDVSQVPKVIRDQVHPAPTGWLVQTMSPTCETCRKPYLCVFDDAPSTPKSSGDARLMNTNNTYAADARRQSLVESLEPSEHEEKAGRTATAANINYASDAKCLSLIKGFEPSDNEDMVANHTAASMHSSNVYVTDGSMEDKYKVVEEPDRIATYIGENGFGMQTTVTNDMQIGNIAIKQCRFERDDWNKWIGVLKQHYRNIMGIMRSDNSMIDSFNYQLAHPSSPSYFENEVNLYIDPDTQSSEYKRQNKIWQDAIIGFYYTASTCEEQLSPLEGVPSEFYGEKVQGTVDRCNGFFGMDTSDRRKWEKDRMEMSRKLVHQVADMFNKNQKRNVPVYKCTADSNAFPNYKSFVTAFNGDTKLSSIFQLDDKM